MVLLREFADGLCLVPVGLPQLDLVALQLALQMLDVRLQLGDAAFPLPLSTLKTPTQLVLLLLQVLRVDETVNTFIYVSKAQNIKSGWMRAMTSPIMLNFSHSNFMNTLHLSLKWVSWNSWWCLKGASPRGFFSI